MIGRRRSQLVGMVGALVVSAACCEFAAAAEPGVSFQALHANIQRVVEALDMLGAPLPAAARQALVAAQTARDVAALQAALDRHAALVVTLAPGERVELAAGAAPLALQQAGYVPLVVKIINPVQATRSVKLTSPLAGPVYGGEAESTLKRQGQTHLKSDLVRQAAPERVVALEWFTDQPMTGLPRGVEIEYALALAYCGSADLSELELRAELAADGIGPPATSPPLTLAASVAPAVSVRLRVRDFDGALTTGRFTFRDRHGHVFPPQAKRLAPDFFFQQQIYRRDGDVVLLPPGELLVESSRGPEYKLLTRTVTIPHPSAATTAEPHELAFDLERWIHPQARGYYGGDHHIHAAGCAHYTLPTQGVLADDMFLQVKGEGLNVGSVLTWGPCFEYQRQFFGAGAHPLSEPLTLLKYDVEVSGFGSAALGHVCLLNLRDHDYPGAAGTKLKGWPTWTVPVLRWTKEQGGVTGIPHSASGMAIDPAASTARMLAAHDKDADRRLSAAETKGVLLPEPAATIDRDRNSLLDEAELTASHARAAETLPNYAVSESSLEVTVSAALGVCDFISAMDTERIQEWNTWYHLMNCGVPIKCAGETDFPCMSSTRVGQGRTYVQLGAAENFNYVAWCRGLADGRSYVSDGFAHALGFAVNEKTYGTKIELAEPGRVTVTAEVAFSSQTPAGVPYGTVPAAGGLRQVGDTRFVYPADQRPQPPERIVEVVVNGVAVAKQTVPADDKPHQLSFTVPIERSSWVALRQFPQLHTNPIEVVVAGRPLRPSRRSAQWCLLSIEQLERARGKFIAPAEREAAAKAYAEAKEFYRRIMAESDVE